MSIFYKTFGCKVNQYETELIRTKLESLGELTVNEVSEANTIIINTCSVTRDAESKARNYIRKFRKHNKNAAIIVTGCYSQREKNGLSELVDNIYVYGNELKTDFNAVWKRIFPHSGLFGDIKGIESFSEHTRAFIKIQDGCDSFCSYCIVPYLRPELSSRPSIEILSEVERLVKNGYREIVLCGIRLGKYNDRFGLAGLIKSITEIDGDFRLRLSSIEAVDVDERLIDIMKSSGKICKHLHIPLQSGSNEILKLMNRPYNVYQFGRIMKNLKNIVTDIAVSTDVIVGFPGENKKTFEDTYSLINELGFSRLHVFSYSPRPGTKAFELKDNIDHKFAKLSSEKIRALGETLELKYASSQIGKQQRVLPETHDTGYTDGYITVDVKEKSGAGFKYGILHNINGRFVV